MQRRATQGDVALHWARWSRPSPGVSTHNLSFRPGAIGIRNGPDTGGGEWRPLASSVFNGAPPPIASIATLLRRAPVCQGLVAPFFRPGYTGTVDPHRAYELVSRALDMHPRESLLAAAQRCLAEGTGRQDVAAVVLQLEGDALLERAESRVRGETPEPRLGLYAWRGWAILQRAAKVARCAVVK